MGALLPAPVLPAQQGVARAHQPRRQVCVHQGRHLCHLVAGTRHRAALQPAYEPGRGQRAAAERDPGVPDLHRGEGFFRIPRRGSGLWCSGFEDSKVVARLQNAIQAFLICIEVKVLWIWGLKLRESREPKQRSGVPHFRPRRRSSREYNPTWRTLSVENCSSVHMTIFQVVRCLSCHLYGFPATPYQRMSIYAKASQAHAYTQTWNKAGNPPTRTGFLPQMCVASVAHLYVFPATPHQRMSIIAEAPEFTLLTDFGTQSGIHENQKPTSTNIYCRCVSHPSRICTSSPRRRTSA